MLCNRFENTGASAVGQQFFWRLFIVYFRIEMGSQWFVRKGSFFTKSHLHFPKSHCKMMFTKVGMGLAVALPGARAGVWVPFRRQWPRALSVSEAAGLIRLEPRLWAGMVVRILSTPRLSGACPARANLPRADASERGHLAVDSTLPGAGAGVVWTAGKAPGVGRLVAAEWRICRRTGQIRTAAFF
jgi:hypothetical protein